MSFSWFVCNIIVIYHFHWSQKTTED
jgi:hypothetical protein